MQKFIGSEFETSRANNVRMSIPFYSRNWLDHTRGIFVNLAANKKERNGSETVTILSDLIAK